MKPGTVPCDSVVFLRIYALQSYSLIVFIDFIPMNRFPVIQFPVDRFPIPRFPMYRLPVARFPVYRFSVYRSLSFLLFGGTDHLSFGSVIVGIYTGLWFIQEIILNPEAFPV